MIRYITTLILSLIPNKSWRILLTKKIINTINSNIEIEDNWVIFYDTFSKNGNGDSIRAIAEKLKKQHNKVLKIFFVSKKKRDIDMADEVLIIGSYRYFHVLDRAKYLLSPMDLPITKSNGQIWFMTWHGTPLKKLYLSKEKSYKFYRYINKFKEVDYFCISNPLLKDIYKEAMQIKTGQFLCYGLPRNDILIRNNNDKYINCIKEKIGIPKNKKILFYCPTWRQNDLKTTNAF